MFLDIFNALLRGGILAGHLAIGVFEVMMWSMIGNGFCGCLSHRTAGLTRK